MERDPYSCPFENSGIGGGFGGLTGVFYVCLGFDQTKGVCWILESQQELILRKNKQLFSPAARIRQIIMTQTSLSAKTPHTFGAEAFLDVKFILSDQKTIFSLFGPDPASFYILRQQYSACADHRPGHSAHEIRERRLYTRMKSRSRFVLQGEDWDEFVQRALGSELVRHGKPESYTWYRWRSTSTEYRRMVLSWREICTIEGALTEGKVMVNSEALPFWDTATQFLQELSGKFYYAGTCAWIKNSILSQLRQYCRTSQPKKYNTSRQHAVSGVVRARSDEANCQTSVKTAPEVLKIQ